MSAKKKDITALLLCCTAVVIMLAALLTTSFMASSIEPVGKSASELLRVADQLDSVTSIRTILFSYSQQFSVAEEHLNRALSTALGFLTLASMLVVALVVALMGQVRRVRQLKEQLAKAREAR